ncbi:MAG: FKBP-type peptidyl-prolyl cis-trans isomerase [Alphaproteobacteria bacterium]|nr:MAG: FKBP-type peptidyl-prolyl cis-trans isomerase [Alphaproteobacteria bacterium]
MSDYDQLAYLIENGQREGVEVTPTKLQLLPLKLSGSVLRPKATDMVKVHYEGRFIDGRVFDSSYNGPPAVFPLNGVIPGWTEGLQHMAIGDKFELTIPSELAYGDQGYPGAIPPNTTLVFDVELLGIVGKEAEAEAEAAALQAAEEALSSEAAPSGEAALSSEEAVPSTEEAVPSTEEAVEADAAVAPIEAAIEEMPEEEPQATDPAGDETEPAASTGQTQPQDE